MRIKFTKNTLSKKNIFLEKFSDENLGAVPINGRNHEKQKKGDK